MQTPHNNGMELTALRAAAHTERYAYMRQRIGFDPVGSDGRWR